MTLEPPYGYPWNPPFFSHNSKTVQDFTTRELIAELRQRKVDAELLAEVVLPKETA